jgi:hypothetical protein
VTVGAALEDHSKSQAPSPQDDAILLIRTETCGTEWGVRNMSPGIGSRIRQPSLSVATLTDGLMPEREVKVSSI